MGLVKTMERFYMASLFAKTKTTQHLKCQGIIRLPAGEVWKILVGLLCCIRSLNNN